MVGERRSEALKRAYVKPKLVRHGSLKALTQGTSGLQSVP